MVDDPYENSSCPYHRALYWLVPRWVELIAILVLTILALTLILV